MSDRRIYILQPLPHPSRKLAAAQVMLAADGYVCRIEAPTRTLEQSARMWAMLNEISAQVEWYGRKLDSSEWKNVFSAALKRQDVVPGIDGGFVVMAQSTSRMTKKEMSDLMEIMSAFGSSNNVKFSDRVV